MPPTKKSPAKVTPNLIFHPEDALRALICVTPAILSGYISQNIAITAILIVGLIPLGISPLAAQRKDRFKSIIRGIAFALAIILGSLLGPNFLIAAAGLFLLGAISVFLTPRRPVLGSLLMSIIIPATAIGTSFIFPQASLQMAVVILLGSVWSLVVNLFWPEKITSPLLKKPLATKVSYHLRAKEKAETDLRPINNTPLKMYGFLFGAAGAIGIIIDHFASFSHLGWTAAAATLIMRPNLRTLEVRSVGRALSTVIGVVLATFFSLINFPLLLYIPILALTYVIAVATRASRWYITSGCTGFLIITMIFVNYPSAALGEAADRIIETLIGAGLALLFGVAIPFLWEKYLRKKN